MYFEILVILDYLSKLEIVKPIEYGIFQIRTAIDQ